MVEKKISSPKKKLLYVGLFILPFLIAMGLIYISVNLGTLPIMNKNGRFVKLKYKNPPEYYTIPEFSLPTFNDDTVHFRHKDSVLYMITMFHKENVKEWEKHILYIGGKIIKRANNIKVISIFENDPKILISSIRDRPKSTW